MHFFVLILITLIKQTNTTFVNLRGASVLFYVTPILVRKSALIKWRRDCNQLTGLISSSSEALSRLAGLLVTLGFSSQIRKKAFPNVFLEYHQRKKIEQSKGQMCSSKALLCYTYTITFF